jgi:5'-3' exonuclease
VKYALFDMSFLAHRAKHATGQLSTGDSPTGIIYGVLEQVRHICSVPQVKTNQCGLFFDGPKQWCARRKAYPAYKNQPARRKKTPVEAAADTLMFKQLATLRRDILPAIGFPVYRQVGLEADDLIASAAETNEAIIISPDSDLWQCVRDGVVCYDPLRQTIMDADKLYTEHRVGPREWAEVKCLAGCHTDNVAGVPGVGVKTATDYIWQLLPAQSKKRLAIQSLAGQEIMWRNAKLVCLPHSRTHSVTLRPPEYKPDVFFTIAAEYGFKSLLESRRGAWEMFFNGEFSVTDKQQAGIRRRNA